MVDFFFFFKLVLSVGGHFFSSHFFSVFSICLLLLFTEMITFEAVGLSDGFTDMNLKGD